MKKNELKKQQRTAIITVDTLGLVTSNEEKPEITKGNLAAPPFYCYKAEDIWRISQAVEDGCNIDALGSFATWLSKEASVHAWVVPGKRYDIGDMQSYEDAKEIFSKNS